MAGEIQMFRGWRAVQLVDECEGQVDQGKGIYV